MFLLRVLAVWLVIVCVEVIHGTLRTLFLAPHVGDFQARQIAVFTGCLLILAVATLFIRWIRPESSRQLTGIGVIWLVLMLAFEFGFGRFGLGLSWERLASDYDISRGGLMSIGVLFLTLSPFVAARLRGMTVTQRGNVGAGVRARV